MAPGGDCCAYNALSHQITESCFSVNTEEESQSLSLINTLQELLHCPVCKSLIYPPIHQCAKGHIICAACKTRAHKSCATCQVRVGEIRCLALERVAALLELPCRYRNIGCSDMSLYYSKLRHEEHCRFRPYNCPYAGSECLVKGDIAALLAHLKDDHRVDIHHGSTFNHRYVKSNPCEVDSATWTLTIFSCFGRQFCLHFEAFPLEGAPVYMAFVRFMGEEIDARKFRYSLEVGGHGSKLVWEGVPRSIRESCKKVRDSQEGLIIPRKLALLFSGTDRQELKLRVPGRIWKEL